MKAKLKKITPIILIPIIIFVEFMVLKDPYTIINERLIVYKFQAKSDLLLNIIVFVFNTMLCSYLVASRGKIEKSFATTFDIFKRTVFPLFGIRVAFDILVLLIPLIVNLLYTSVALSAESFYMISSLATSCIPMILNVIFFVIMFAIIGSKCYKGTTYFNKRKATGICTAVICAGTVTYIGISALLTKTILSSYDCTLPGKLDIVLIICKMLLISIVWISLTLFWKSITKKSVVTETVENSPEENYGKN